MSQVNPDRDLEILDEDEVQFNAISSVDRIVRARSIHAAASLLLQTGMNNPDLLDELEEREEEYFRYKMRRNIRRDKLQTILKLFGFRSTQLSDPAEPEREVLSEVAETTEQATETRIVNFFEKYRLPFLVLVTAVQLWYVIVIPFRLCYDVPRELLGVIFETLICDLTMIIAIIVRIYEPVDQAGVLRWNGKNENYWLSSLFFYDILANLPFDFLGLALGSNCTLAFERCALLSPYWQVNKLLNARGSIDNLMEATEAFLQRYLIHPFFALVIAAFLVQAYFWHLFACLMMLDVIRLRDSFEIITNGDTHMLNSSIPLQYASSLDWSSKVLAGWDRGEASPVDVGSFVFNAAAVIVGCCVMTTFVAFVSSAVEMITPYIQQTINIDTIMDIVEYKHGPPDLKLEMITDSWYRYDSKVHMMQFTEVAGEIPPELHDKLLHHEGLRFLSRVTLFAPLLSNKRFVIEIARLMEPLVMAPNEVLFEKGDTGDAMYFVVIGELGVVDANTKKPRWIIGPGKYVGEIAVLLGAVRTAAVVVMPNNHVRLLSLSKADFGLLKRRFPNTFAEVHQRARDRWMELNQALLEKAKEIGRKEIDEIAKKRWDKMHHLAIGVGVGSERRRSRLNSLPAGVGAGMFQESNAMISPQQVLAAALHIKTQKEKEDAGGDQEQEQLQQYNFPRSVTTDDQLQQQQQQSSSPHEDVPSSHVLVNPNQFNIGHSESAQGILLSGLGSVGDFATSDKNKNRRFSSHHLQDVTHQQQQQKQQEQQEKQQESPKNDDEDDTAPAPTPFSSRRRSSLINFRNAISQIASREREEKVKAEQQQQQQQQQSTPEINPRFHHYSHYHHHPQRSHTPESSPKLKDQEAYFTTRPLSSSTGGNGSPDQLQQQQEQQSSTTIRSSSQLSNTSKHSSFREQSTSEIILDGVNTESMNNVLTGGGSSDFVGGSSSPSPLTSKKSKDKEDVDMDNKYKPIFSDIPLVSSPSSSSPSSKKSPPANFKSPTRVRYSESNFASAASAAASAQTSSSSAPRHPSRSKSGSAGWQKVRQMSPGRKTNNTIQVSVADVVQNIWGPVRNSRQSSASASAERQQQQQHRSPQKKNSPSSSQQQQQQEQHRPQYSPIAGDIPSTGFEKEEDASSAGGTPIDSSLEVESSTTNKNVQQQQQLKTEPYMGVFLQEQMSKAAIESGVDEARTFGFEGVMAKERRQARFQRSAMAPIVEFSSNEISSASAPAPLTTVFDSDGTNNNNTNKNINSSNATSAAAAASSSSSTTTTGGEKKKLSNERDEKPAEVWTSMFQQQIEQRGEEENDGDRGGEESPLIPLATNNNNNSNINISSPPAPPESSFPPNLTSEENSSPMIQIPQLQESKSFGSSTSSPPAPNSDGDNSSPSSSLQNKGGGLQVVSETTSCFRSPNSSSPHAPPFRTATNEPGFGDEEENENNQAVG